MRCRVESELVRGREEARGLGGGGGGVGGGGVEVVVAGKFRGENPPDVSVARDTRKPY